ncbi:MAG: SDR family oxidoreductase [Polyangiaceae bacterium]|nr:SDR family oxidoreductase [Polyangiaceae bacterium]
MKKLEGKTALVTGGTTGIGLAAARLFAEQGAKVLVTGRNPETLEAARAELGPAVEVLASDAGAKADLQAIAGRLDGSKQTLDLLFLNAGVAKFGPIASLPEEDFDETFRVNVKGPWLALKILAPYMSKGGSIVVNSSVNNVLGMPGSSAYAASKAALRSLVRTAAAELAPSGVRVNAVSPGPIATPLYGKLGLSEAARQGFAEGLVQRIPLKRFGTSEEIARAVLFLGSEDASFMTGEEIVVDGGMTRV